MENETITRTRAPRRAASDSTITMRIPGGMRNLIDTAAAALGKSRTEFMLDCARDSATEVLLSKLVFDIGKEQSAELAQLLENPPAPVAELRALISSWAPWD
jgi:uncharacterized protein (DUF1778 family)